ncbi:hypothetical protein [Nocardioides nanhaiensis]|uniref:Uncharacterized protein n=1 Tax=Nocardioides nanhaiensis TaxID=1476871 RepID=A0ABP8W2X1_9ACTN
MTDRLTSTLHERADAEQFAVPDVEALVRAGDRRVRRRRTALAAGGAALAVVAGVALGQALPGRGEAPQPAPAPEQVDIYPVQERDLPPMVVVGGDVAWVDGVTEKLRAPADELVRTSVGWVYASYEGVFSRTDTGTRRVPGVTGDLLVSDEDGVLVGVYDLHEGGAVLRVLDQRTDELRVVVDDLPEESGVLALDGDRIYWYDTAGTWVQDLSTGEREPAPEGLSSVEAGTIVSNPGADQGFTTAIETRDGVERGLEWSGDVGALSPDGAWYASDDAVGFPGAPGAVLVETGRRVRLQTGTERGDLVLINGWLDATTLQVGISPMAEAEPNRLLTCTVPDGRCEVVLADVLSVVPGAQFRQFVGPAAP